MSDVEQHEILTIAIVETKKLLSVLEGLRSHPKCNGSCEYCKRQVQR